MTKAMQPKPPTQVAAAKGIEAKPITMNEPSKGVDWRELSALPPFQMFIGEKFPCPAGEILDRWTLNKAEHLILATSQRDLFDRYAEWHTDKGYWPDETPFGELRG